VEKLLIMHSGAGKKFFGLAPQLFLALKVQLVVLVSAYVMVSTVLSVYCLLFFYSRCPRAHPFVKRGSCFPRALWSRLHWSCSYLRHCTPPATHTQARTYSV